MYPGIGVGGYCLTKDPLLASWARKSFFGSASDLNMSINSVSVNDQMPVFAFDRLVEVFGDLAEKKVILRKRMKKKFTEFCQEIEQNLTT